MAQDGTFAVDGVPPGTWTVQLVWSTSIGTSDGYPLRQTSQVVGSVTLQDGATTTFDIEAPFAIPGGLEGVVLHNGAPLADSTVWLSGNFGKDVNDFDLALSWQVKTDAEGRFAARVRAGDFRATWRKGEGKPVLQSMDRATVVEGSTTTQTFHIESGTVRVRLLDANGAPVANVNHYLYEAAANRSIAIPATDADGRLEIDAEAGTYAFRVLPKRLQDPKAQQELWQKRVGNTDPLTPFWLTIGTVAIPVANVAEVELRLPADW